MNEFTHEMFGTLRTVEINGAPGFVASDVTRALGVGNVTMALASLDDDEFSTTDVVDSAGRRQPNTKVVSEAGFYSLVMRSRKPEAKQFKRWVTHDVLPAIRRDGGYLVDDRTPAQNARFAEMIKYREATDMLTLATDYEPSSREARGAFTRIQDRLLVKVTGMHGPEIRATREIKHWKGKNGPTKADRAIAKNYLSDDELTQLAGYGDIVLGSIKVAYPAAGYTVEKFWEAVAEVMARY